MKQNVCLLKDEEKAAGPNDQSNGDVENANLFGHHDSAFAAEPVASWINLPFSCHLRHDLNQFHQHEK